MIDNKQKFNEYLYEYMKDTISDAIKHDLSLSQDKLESDLIFQVLNSPDVDKNSLLPCLKIKLDYNFQCAANFKNLVDLAITAYIQDFIIENAPKILAGCFTLDKKEVEILAFSVYNPNFDYTTWYDELKKNIIDRLEDLW